jgi:hypothetical protein
VEAVAKAREASKAREEKERVQRVVMIFVATMIKRPLGQRVPKEEARLA